MPTVYWLVFATVQGLCHMRAGEKSHKMQEGKARESRELQEEGMARKEKRDEIFKHYSFS